jgi:hypothetical protein
MAKYKTLPVAVIVVPESAVDGAVFSEYSTRIEIEDEGAGAFLLISRPGSERPHDGKLAFDPEELDSVVSAARGLIKGYTK